MCRRALPVCLAFRDIGWPLRLGHPVCRVSPVDVLLLRLLEPLLLAFPVSPVGVLLPRLLEP